MGHWVRRAYSLPRPVQRAGLRALSGEIGVHMDRPTDLAVLARAPEGAAVAVLKTALGTTNALDQDS